VVVSIRQIDRTSDDLIEWMLAGPPRSDPLRLEVIACALAPLAIHRCRRRPDLVDEFLTEIVLVSGAIDPSVLTSSRRHAASVILDRAWDKVRKQIRRPEPVVPASPMLQNMWEAAVEHDEEAVLDGVALCQVRDALARGQEPAAIRAWNTVIELSERPRRTQSERARLRYACRVLRAHTSGAAA
jgi:hypothetical protein